MLISAETVRREESILLLLIPSQHALHTEQRRHRWGPGPVSSSMLKHKPNSLAPATEAGFVQGGKCQPNAFLLSSFHTPSHNNMRGCSVDWEGADIETEGQANKSKVYLATCGPAGEEMAYSTALALRRFSLMNKMNENQRGIGPIEYYTGSFLRITNELYNRTSRQCALLVLRWSE